MSALGELPLFQAVTAARASLRRGIPLSKAVLDASLAHGVDRHAVLGFVRTAEGGCALARELQQGVTTLTEDVKP
ncbi:MAG TPA: hypothetical protein VJ437_11125 [Acidiferrobacterales bacterium]|nr:hypothetical protein [Acidiferrobacterales bacterium]